MDAGPPQTLNWFWHGLEVVIGFLKTVMRWDIRDQGVDNVPANSGAVLVYNHHAYLDFVMLGWPIVRKLRRPVRFLAKAEIWDSWKVRWVMVNVRAVPVERASPAAAKDVLGAGVQALRNGDLVAMAPEQTISQSFELLPFKTGPVRMAQEAGVPIIPIIGWGNHRWLTKGNGLDMKGGWNIPIEVRYGEPVHVPPGADVHAVTEELRATMQTMLREVQLAYPDVDKGRDAWWQPASLGGGARPHAEVLEEHIEREREWKARRGQDGNESVA